MRLLVSILDPDFIFFNRYLEMRLLDNIAVQIFNFLKKLHTAFSTGHANSHPHCQSRRVPFLCTLLAELTVVCLFDDSYSDVKTGREGNDRGWDGCMASPTQWTWVCASSERWWWTGKPGVLRSMGSQRVRTDRETEKQQQQPLIICRICKYFSISVGCLFTLFF